MVAPSAQTKQDFVASNTQILIPHLGKETAAHALIRNGASVNSADKDGKTALHYAAEHGNNL